MELKKLEDVHYYHMEGPPLLSNPYAWSIAGELDTAAVRRQFEVYEGSLKDTGNREAVLDASLFDARSHENSDIRANHISS